MKTQVRQLTVGVLGECSGRVRDAFSSLGHIATSCDLKPSDTEGKHIQGDYMEQDWTSFDILIAFPPCTYLCASGLHWNKRRPDRQVLTDKAIQDFKRLMEMMSQKAIIGWAIENPIGCISTKIKPPTQIIQPWQFGEDAAKSTCLWLSGLPPLTPTHLYPPRIVHGRARWGNQTDSGQNKLGPSETRAIERARTYPGIAKAMAEQWGG